MPNPTTNQITPSTPNLRELTPARVSLPTTGQSIATSEVLAFQLAHAQARDAVHAQLHLPTFAQRLLTELPILTEANIPILQLRSNAPSSNSQSTNNHQTVPRLLTDIRSDQLELLAGEVIPNHVFKEARQGR
jgi:ethanolamine ammonia-lyase small subunit